MPWQQVACVKFALTASGVQIVSEHGFKSGWAGNIPAGLRSRSGWSSGLSLFFLRPVGGLLCLGHWRLCGGILAFITDQPFHLRLIELENLCIKATILEFFKHGAMLILHALFHLRSQIRRGADICIVCTYSRNYGAGAVQQRGYLRTLPPAVFRLNMVRVAFIIEVVIKPAYHPVPLRLSAL